MTVTTLYHACARPAASKHKRWWWIWGLMALASVSWAAEPDHYTHYTIDPVHTRVMFAISHAGFSNAIGTVSGSNGMLSFDPDDWGTATLEVNVPIDRLDLGDAKWNQAALAHGLLDVHTYPVAKFASTRIQPIDAKHATVFGTLTLHGVSKEVKLDVMLNALKRHPLPPFRRTAGFSATTQISRKDFGIDAWPTVIGDQVEIRIEAEATRTRADDADDDKDTDSSTPADSSPSSDTTMPSAPATEAEPAADQTQ